VLAYVCLLMPRVAGHLAPIWLPNAVLLAVLMLSPRAAWTGRLAAGLAGILLGHLTAGSPVLRAAGLTVFNGIEVVIAARLIAWRLGPYADMSLRRATLHYDVLVAIPAAIGASMASLFLWAVYRVPVLDSLFTWGLSDFAGLITITPSVVALATGWRSLQRLPAWRFWPLLLLIVVAVTIFSQSRFPFSYLVAAALMLVSYRLQMAGAAVGLFIALIAAVIGTLLGKGPFAATNVPLTQQMISLQLFIAVSFHLSVPVAFYRQRSAEMQRALNGALAETMLAEAKYRQITEAVQDIIVQTGRDGRFLYVSPSMRALGHDPEQMVGRPVFEYVHPEDLERMRSTRNSFFDGGDPQEGATFRLRVLTGAGDYRLFESRPHMIRNAEGEATALEAVMRDVTDAVAAEEALKTSEARYRLLSEHMSDVVSVLGADGVFRYLSPSVRDIVGYAPEELVGKPSVTIVHPEDAERVRSTFVAHREQGPGAETFKVEFRVVRKDGSVTWVEAHPMALFDEAGEFVEWQDVVREIGDRKAMEAELTAAKIAAEAAAEAKAEFLANMSHELRTPLTGVLGFTKLASSARGLAEPARTYVKRVDEASKALLALVNDILDFSKLEAGDVRFRHEPVDVSELVRSSLRLFEAQAEDKGLHLELVDRLPAGLALELDSDRTRQVLLNLIGNAVKFTDKGGVTVRVRFDRPAGALLVAVKDTGPGIAPERRSDLFKRFSQAHDGRRRYGGTGLGLAICRGIVEAQGGEIGVFSKPGSGSCFHFKLPTRVVSARSRKPTAPNRREKLTVLVADDSPDLQDLVVLFLQDLADVSVAVDGRNAVRIAGHKRFDVMLLDVRMPDLDGPQALRRIRSGVGSNQATPAVALTADTGAGAAQRLLDAGFDAVVYKPFSSVELISTIADIMTTRPDSDADVASVPMYGG
jgi:PAS domain S-box-containing protein